MPSKYDIVISLLTAAFFIALTGVGLILLLMWPWKDTENNRSEDKK